MEAWRRWVCVSGVAEQVREGVGGGRDACYTDRMEIRREGREGRGGVTHPSGGEERAGGVTRTIQKVVSVQL